MASILVPKFHLTDEPANRGRKGARKESEMGAVAPGVRPGGSDPISTRADGDRGEPARKVPMPMPGTAQDPQADTRQRWRIRSHGVRLGPNNISQES
jgi:hypothetical protein